MPSHSLEVLSSLPPTVPAPLAELAEAWTSAAQPAVPRPAASVVLCRDGETGLETFLLHRHARMAFAASMVVFPGGGLDLADRSDDDPWRAAGVRETREETGVQLDPADLLAWAHWITPVVHPIRYDTRFFLAALPPGQLAADLSTETDRAGWARPADALARYGAGTWTMMPPTVSILVELAAATTVAQLVESGHDRRVEVVLPELVRAGTSWEYRYPRPSTRGGLR
ncbi:MAG TPA: NUDIX hydrolase [Microlunatus sp.]|nr:NUDIX hydrolase [Microlunatus sp.]